MMATAHGSRTQKLDLRLTSEAKETISAAAAATHRSVSQFVLESALARAEEALADRRRFGLSAEQWEQFVTALDATARDLPRLSQLLQEPSVFDETDAP